MTRFADTPDWKRGTWNPERGRMDYPPTPSQIRYLKKLCSRLGVVYDTPATKAQAQSRINKMANLLEYKTGIPRAPRRRER